MKKKITIALFCLLIAATNLFAQYTLDWQQNANYDQKQSVMSAVDSLDNVVVTGYLQNYRMFTRKYDISGTLQWEVSDSSGIQSIYEKSNWVNCDANNNILVVGNQYSIGPSYDYPNAIVALKYSPSGTLLWRTIIPISTLINSTTSFDCRSVIDANGNLYIGTAIVGGVFLYKIDTNGNLIFSNSSQINAPKNFNGMRIRNNKIVVGTSSGTPNVAPVFVWDTAGTLLWTANAVGLLAADVEIDENENVYVLSSLYYMPSAISWDYDARLVKYNSTGSLLWSHNYDFGGYNFTTRMTYVNNRISAIGYGNASGLKWQTFQTDTNGTLLWSSPYTEPAPQTVSDSYPKYILAKPSGEVIVTGVGGPTPSPNNPSFNQMPIVQYSNTGVQNWVSTPNIYAGTGLATMFASDGSLFAIGSRNMFVFHYNSLPSSASNNLQSENLISIFPNPFTDATKFTVEITKTASTSISIFDVYGRLLKSIPTDNLCIGKNEIMLDLQDFNSGIYFCSINLDNRFQTIKIVKN
jgi:Secretion system C-terminal sorting domain